MRKLLTIIAFVAMTMNAMADDFVVYAFSGNVLRTSGKNRVNVQVRDKYTDKTVLIIPEKGNIVLLNLNTKEKINVTKAGSGSITEMLKWTGTTSKKSTNTYWTWLMQQISKGGSTVAVGPGTKMGITERDIPTDSIAETLPCVEEPLPVDSISK